MANYRQTLRYWYVGQLAVLNIALFLRLFVMGGAAFSAGGLMLIIWTLTALLPAFEDEQEAWRRSRRFNDYLQTIILFTSLPLLVGNFVDLLIRLGLDQRGLIAVAMTYLIVAGVPVATVVTAKIKSLTGRILILIVPVFSGVVGAQTTLLVFPGLRAPAGFTMVSDSGILGALGIVVTLTSLLACWQVKTPHWRLNAAVNHGITCLLVLLAVAFSLWNAFSDGDSWATTLTHWNFHLEAPTWAMFLNGLEPGIAEEWLYRYAVLSLMLTMVRRSRWRLDWAVWSNGLIFGAWHVTNVLAGQSWAATGEQMAFAAALGWFYAGLYLYSGSIVLPMGLHAFLDILSMMASGSQTMAVPDAFEWQTLLVTVILFAAVTTYLLTGSRRRVIQRRRR